MAAAGSPAWPALVFGLLLGAVGGCADLTFLANAAFPRRVPGLPADQPWVSLPVGIWLTEGAFEPRAVSACLDPGCAAPALVALFSVRGRDAAELLRLAEAGEGRASPPASGRTGSAALRVEPGRREGNLPGFAMRLSRPDGSRPVAAQVIVARRPGALAVVFALAPTEAVALALARDVAPHL